MIRCKWCNLNNPKYIEYHDNEWCKPNFDDKYLFEMLILESFQAGLSWECILNKREDFRKAYDNFDIEKICNYDKMKIQELLLNEKIIRNRLKINASINNSRIFKIRFIRHRAGNYRMAPHQQHRAPDSAEPIYPSDGSGGSGPESGIL